MKALIADATGMAEALLPSSQPVPQPGKTEVLIRVHAAGMNRADILQRKGQYDPPPGITSILGLETAGEVVAVGENVKRWKVGDRVMALLSGGGCAEYVAVPEGQCMPVPEGFSYAQAAVLPEGLATIWANVFEAGKLKSGETVLIHGGASGIGTLGIQMVRVFDAVPLVTVASERKAQACRELGAALAVLYPSQDFVIEVLTFTQNRGVDIVLDLGGGEYVPRNIQVLGPGGRHISIATQHGRMAKIDLRAIMLRGLTLTGSMMRSRPVEEKARLLREVEANILPHVAAGRIKPVIFQTFPLEKAGDAHKLMESGAHIGKIVLTV